MVCDQRFQRFEVVPLTGALGADVRGVDLAANPHDDTFTELRRVLDCQPAWNPDHLSACKSDQGMKVFSFGS
jgi:hypothetical protein